jgi:hypothetical protein
MTNVAHLLNLVKNNFIFIPIAAFTLISGYQKYARFFFSFSPNKLKKEHQSDLDSVTSWTPNPWKASLHHAIPPHRLVPKLLV